LIAQLAAAEGDLRRTERQAASSSGGRKPQPKPCWP
jgi:hypothetical protein